MNGIDEIKWDKDGLAPAIAQDAATGQRVATSPGSCPESETRESRFGR